MDKNHTHIDPKEINIKITELDPPDFKLEFEIPQRLVKRIYKKLKKGGYNYDDQRMTGLLAKICLAEGIFRLDRDTVWGLMPMEGAPPPAFSVDAPFKFTSVTDTYTLEDIPGLDKIQIKRLQLEVTDEMVEQEIQAQKLECGVRTPHDGTIDVGDELTGTVSLTIDGETGPEFTLNGVCIQIQDSGKITVIGNFPFEGINEQLQGTKPNGSLTISTQVPLSYSVVEKRGKPATLTMQVDSVVRIEPATIDEVLQQYGTPNEHILRSQITVSLERNFNRENELIMLNQLYEYFDDVFEIPLPERMVQDRFARQCKAIEEQFEDDKKLTDEDKNSLLSNARSFIKRQAITARLRKHFDIKVNEVDIDAQIRNIAERKRARPEDIKNEYITSDRLNVVSNVCAEFKILDALKAQITFIDE